MIKRPTMMCLAMLKKKKKKEEKRKEKKEEEAEEEAEEQEEQEKEDNQNKNKNKKHKKKKKKTKHKTDHSEVNQANVVDMDGSDDVRVVRLVVQVVDQVSGVPRAVDPEEGQGRIGGRVRDVVDDEEGRGASQPHGSVLPREGVVPALCDVDLQRL